MSYRRIIINILKLTSKTMGIEMLWLSPRVNYIKSEMTTASGVPFQSGYLCHGILNHQLEFEYLQRK